MTKKENILLLLVIGVFFCSGCGKKSCDGKREIDYLFTLPVSISAAKDTFHVGDTIWIENTFSDNIYNENNSKTYKVANFDFKNYWAITDLNTPAPSTTYLSPRIIDYVGSTTGSYIGSVAYQSLGIKYDYEKGIYSYRVAFVPDKPGMYVLGFFSDVNNTHVDFTQCPNEKIELHYAVNNKGNNNFEMLQYARDSYYNNYTLERFNNEGDFCFCVK